MGTVKNAKDLQVGDEIFLGDMLHRVSRVDFHSTMLHEIFHEVIGNHPSAKTWPEIDENTTIIHSMPVLADRPYREDVISCVPSTLRIVVM